MSSQPRSSGEPTANSPSSVGFLIFSWFFVGVPLVWGVIQTLIKSMALFH
jgi:hypothetical protein